MKTIAVKKAKYIEGCKIKLVFNDNVTNIVGNIVWGKDWDMIFPVYDLYKGTIKYNKWV